MKFIRLEVRGVLLGEAPAEISLNGLADRCLDQAVTAAAAVTITGLASLAAARRTRR